MSIHIFDIQCDKCGAKCWVNNGDVTDDTVPDIDAVVCWSCGKTVPVDADECPEDPEQWNVEKSFSTASNAAAYKEVKGGAE